MLVFAGAESLLSPRYESQEARHQREVAVREAALSRGVSAEFLRILGSTGYFSGSNNQFGILVCGSGIGMDITANKHKNIRAALCYNIKSTKLSRQHNNANVMAIGARLTKKNVVLKCVSTFMKTDFEGGRHQRRVKKI